MISVKYICFIILFAFCAYYYKRNRPLLLAIGILSSRENFEFRKAARSTWLKEYLPNKNAIGKAWFVIGKNECNIPPPYRLSKYGCEKWIINSTGLQNMFYTSEEIAISSEVSPQSCHSVSKKGFSQGFSFKVNHPVIIRRLGILIKLLVPDKKTKIAVLDIQSREVLSQTTIMLNSSYIKNGYLYQEVESILLPKDFEGMVLVEGYLQSEICANVFFNNGSGVITFKRIYSTPHHLGSLQFNDEYYSAASIQFLVNDIEVLKSAVLNEKSVTEEWVKRSESLDEQLKKENVKYKDIVFVDVIDTYRNLPLKLLHFFKQLNDQYDFLHVLKTDDDTVVDISTLSENLKHLQFKGGHWIWSQFRLDWPVNYIGKWADYDYTSSIYPAFPCGAAYAIPKKTLQWLSSNIQDLFPYQGEDVSMGVWLSAIKPSFIYDNKFECDSKCKESSYNRAQLTVEQIYEVWSLYEKCHNLCFCE